MVRVTGLVPYADALALQMALAGAVRAGRRGLGDVLVLLQHRPTYSLGRRLAALAPPHVDADANASDPAPAGAPDLRGFSARALALATGAEVIVSSRGGRATYHGPGQVVAYPIVSLRGLGIMPRAWVHGLEACTARALNSAFFEVRPLDEQMRAAAHMKLQKAKGVWSPQPPPELNPTRRRRPSLLEALGAALEARPGVGSDRTGVWVGDAKVAAVGVQVTQGVSVHGVAINVAVDLERFRPIVPCGIDDAQVTSVRRLLRRRFMADDAPDVDGDEIDDARDPDGEWAAAAEQAMAHEFAAQFGHARLSPWTDLPAEALRTTEGVRAAVRAICAA